MLWLPQVAFEEQGAVTVQTQAPLGSMWFDGHFPDNPVLPGVAMLALVEETIFRHLSNIPEERASVSYRQVRFKAIVRPGHQLKLRITQFQPEQYNFALQSNGTLASTGTCYLSPLSGP